MKKFIKILTFSLTLVLLIGLFHLPISNFAMATEREQKTVFVVSPTFIMATDGGVYMFDNSDKNIKLISHDSTQAKSYYVGEILDGYSCEEKIYFLTTSSLIVFDTTDDTFVSQELDCLTQEYSHISVSKIDETIYVCIYGNSTNVAVKYGKFETNQWTFENAITITTSQLNPETGISCLKLIEFDGNVYLARSYSQSLSLYQISLDASMSTSLNILFDLSDNDNGDIFSINWFGTDVLVVTYDQITYFYKFSTALDTDHATKYSKTHNHEDEGFSVLSSSMGSSNFYLLSDDCYYYLNLSSVDSLGLFQKVGNTSCNIEYITDKSNFKFYKVTSDSDFISALGSTSALLVEQGKYVVEIANVTIQDDTDLVGYKYVLYLHYYQDSNNVWQSENLYGYIESSNLSEIEPEQKIGTIKVDDQTHMYSLPSVKVDSSSVEEQNLNKIVCDLQKALPVEILFTFGEFQTGYQESENDYFTNYALVKFEDNVGFIDMAHIVSPDKRENRVFANATIVKKSFVYKNASVNSDVIYILEKDTPVTILESRNSDGLVKIGFYDQNGNYFEGYMLYANVNSYSHTALQIIGSLLVTINVVLLVFLVYTKKKVIKT